MKFERENDTLARKLKFPMISTREELNLHLLFSIRVETQIIAIIFYNFFYAYLQFKYSSNKSKEKDKNE